MSITDLSTVEIHPTAIVNSKAVLGAGTIVKAYSIIGEHVRIGNNNLIGPHAVIEGHTTIGDENIIFQFASIGAVPQDLKYRGEPSELHIGNRNKIREYTTLQPGTKGGGMLTSIGNDNLFMACSHVGHDCKIGNSGVFANCALVAGHVSVGDSVILGGGAGVHQFVRIGNLSLVSAGAMVNKDVPPFCLVHGDRAGLVGLNTVGLKRHGFSVEQIALLNKVYRGLFLSKTDTKESRNFTVNNFTSRLAQLQQEFSDSLQVQELLSFIKDSKRGICFPRILGGDDSDFE